MAIRLVDALRETLEGWIEDIDPAWRPIVADVTLGFDDVDPDLMLEPWEPIFPARKGRIFPGQPKALICCAASMVSIPMPCAA